MIQKIQPQSLDLQTFHRPDLLLPEMLQLTYSPFSLSYVALPIDSVVQARTLNQTHKRDHPHPLECQCTMRHSPLRFSRIAVPNPVPST
jgi:hypothetical protein